MTNSNNQLQIIFFLWHIAYQKYVSAVHGKMVIFCHYFNNKKGCSSRYDVFLPIQEVKSVCLEMDAKGFMVSPHLTDGLNVRSILDRTDI